MTSYMNPYIEFAAGVLYARTAQQEQLTILKMPTVIIMKIPTAANEA